MPAPGPLELLIFDLDGTLIDSCADLVASVNATLSHLGRAPLAEELIARYVGDGAARLIERALGGEPEAELQAAALEYFLDYYAAHKLDRTTLYPGVEEGLAALGAAGFALAVLSNKPVRPSREIVAALGIGGYFFAVEGGNSFAQKKPDPVGILALARARGLAPAAAAMIGDSAVDIRAGRNAGAYTCGVTYGFRPDSFAAEPPDAIAASFAQLTAGLLALRPCPAAPRA
ncbi:MAG: HAD-IA family hydrolase [Terriglobales bacterium]